MNFELFVAKGLIQHKTHNYSASVVRITIISISLSVAVMLVSLSVLSGFQKSIKDKIIGFGSHIQVVKFTVQGNYSSNTINLDSEVINSISSLKEVKKVVPTFSKEAAIVEKNDFKGVILKGITDKYDTSFFSGALLYGKMPKIYKDSQQEIIISQLLAQRLNKKVGDKIKVYFYLEGKYRTKNFTISGIFDTGLADYDQRFLICSAKVLKEINSIAPSQYSCYEITLNDFANIEATNRKIYDILPQEYTTQTIKDIEPNLFSWLNLLNSNVVMIICIMIIITIVCLSSVVIIIIFEKKTLVGVLKSFGVENRKIERIFVYRISYLTLKGIIIGTTIALSVELIQKLTNIISLDPQSYYLTSIPIDINIWHIISIDLGSFVICVLCMLMPTKIINKLSVVKNLKFE